MKQSMLVLLLTAVLGLAILPSCALQPKPVAELKMPGNLSDAGKEAQKMIVEANVALVAAYSVIGTNVADDTLPVKDAISYIATLDSYVKQVDAAQAALDLGNIGDAKTQAELLNRLITALHKQVVEHAKGK